MLTTTNSRVILKDDHGNSVNMDDLSDGFQNEGIVNPSFSGVNIENSTDVILGPVTQFNGPVTIYPSSSEDGIRHAAVQKKLNDHFNDDAKLVKSDSTASDSPQNDFQCEKLYKNCCSSKTFRIIFTLCVIIAILFGLVTLIQNSHHDRQYRPEHHNPTTPPDHDEKRSNNTIPLGEGLLITRKGWNGHKPLKFNSVEKPLKFVIIYHSATPVCTTYQACSMKVFNIQAYHMEQGMDDIGYNFLIAGDGNAYEGRGWDAANMRSNNSLSISFIGNYVVDELTQQMIAEAKALLDFGVKTGKLSIHYRLVAHNQTAQTLSPGSNVYKIIKTWPHFDEGLYLDL